MNRSASAPNWRSLSSRDPGLSRVGGPVSGGEPALYEGGATTLVPDPGIVAHGPAATVLEIPPVDRAATRSIESKGMSSRVNVVSGNMFEELPTGYDIHLFANAFHDWDKDSLEKLSSNSFNSLSAGGIIAVFDAHLYPSKQGPLSIAEYSCLLMHSTEGKCYSTREIDDILTSAGFAQIKVTNIAADRSLITGKKN